MAKDYYLNAGGTTFSESKRNVRDCVIYNVDTKVAFRCQYNPEDLPRSRSVSYATITSPGMAYPLIQFVSGDAEDVDINLFFYNRESSRVIDAFEKFVEGLLPPKHNSSKFKRPPVFKLYYGKTVESYVLVKKSINQELLNSNGDPYLRSYTLTARRI